MAIFTSQDSLEGSWVVYFNGIEVPTSSVSIDMGVWVVPSATIEMPPDKELFSLGAQDRVQVQVFTLDHHYTALRGKVPDFRVLYEGTIEGWQFSQTKGSRQISFRSVNYLDILDALYTYLMTGLDNMVMGMVEAKKNPNAIASAQFFPAALLYTGLDPSQEKMIRRPFDMLENAIRACMGGEEQSKFGSVPTINFFTRYMRRTMFNNRILPSPLLEIDHMRIDTDSDPEGVFPVLRYVRYQDTLNALSKHADSIGSSTSVYKILRDTYMRMYYEILAIPNAPIAQVNFLGGGVNGEVIGPPVLEEKPETVMGAVGSLLSGTAASVVGKAIQKNSWGPRPNRILNYITKPRWEFGIPPACNVIFPSMIENLAFGESYASQVTRMYINDDWIPNMLQQSDDAMAQFAIVTTGYPPQVQKELDKRGNPSGKGEPAVSGKNMLIWPEEYFKGPVVGQEPFPSWFHMLLAASKTTTQYGVQVPPIEQDPFLDKLGWTIPPGDGALAASAVGVVNIGIQHIIDATTAAATDRPAAIDAKLSWLQQVYTRCEYQRQRASCRSGVVTTVFNPYIVPGFPAVIFDDLTTGNHLIAYVNSIKHNLAQNNMSTTVTFSHVQTLDEYLRGIRESRLGENLESRVYKITANPPNPIPEIRLVEQVFENADEYFRQLFHQRQTYGDKIKTAAFDITKAINLKMPSGEIVSMTFVIGDELSNFVPPVTDWRGMYMDKYQSIVPSENFAPMFKDADAAMRFISRPICTLEEFIDFHEKGVREGKIDPNQPQQAKGATYYEKILNFQQGPGPAPEIDQNNNPLSVVTADTRTDWETRLLNYRKKIIFMLHPHES